MDSMQINKGKYKTSLFRCFKAVVDEGDDFKPLRRRYRNATTVTDPVLAYLVAADVDGVVLISTTAAIEECESHRRKGGRDTWHSVKMALNETSLMRRIQSRRKTRKSHVSRSNINPTSYALQTPQKENLKIINKHKSTGRTTSNTSSNIVNSSTIFPSSPSKSSTTSSNIDYVSNTPSHEINIIPKSVLNGTNGVSKKNDIVEDKRKRNIALSILWIFSLLVLILWGKFFAILCTSIWLYIVPSRQRRECKEEGSLYTENDFDSLHQENYYGRDT
ncbi:unnamed protein product [Lathyrus oleraceus]